MQHRYALDKTALPRQLMAALPQDSMLTYLKIEKNKLQQKDNLAQLPI